MSEQLANEALPVVKENYNVVAESIHLDQQKPDYEVMSVEEDAGM